MCIRVITTLTRRTTTHNFSKDHFHYLLRCLYTRTYCPVLSPYASFGKLPVDSFPLLYTCGINLSASHRYCVLSDLYTLLYCSYSIHTGSVHPRKEEYQDNTDRIEVERFFSTEKRCNGAGLIMTKLEETTLSSIAMSVLVTNLFAVDLSGIIILWWMSLCGDII